MLFGPYSYIYIMHRRKWKAGMITRSEMWRRVCFDIRWERMFPKFGR